MQSTKSKNIEEDSFYQKIKADRIKKRQNVTRLCLEIAYYFELSKISAKNQTK